MTKLVFADSLVNRWEACRKGKLQSLDSLSGDDWYLSIHDGWQEQLVRSCIQAEYSGLAAGYNPEQLYQHRMQIERSDAMVKQIEIERIIERLEADEGCLRTAVQNREAMLFPHLNINEVWSNADAVLPVGSKGWKIIRVLPSARLKSTVISQIALFYQGMIQIGAEHVEVEFRYYYDTEQYTVKPGTRLVRQRVDDVIRQTVTKLSVPQSRCTSGGDDQPESPYHVRYLLRGKVVGRKLLESGIADMREIPESQPLSARQRSQIRALESGQHIGDVQSLRAWMNDIVQPIIFLDFESIQSSRPLFRNTHPWQYVPVMYSSSDECGNQTWQHLPPDSDDLSGFGEKLARLLQDGASVGVFGDAMEIHCLSLLASEVCSDDARQVLRNALDNIVDLHRPFEEGWVYFPDQRGKTSLKYLARLFDDDGYGDHDVSDGRQASLQYYWQRCGYPDGTWPVRLRAEQMMQSIETYSRADTYYLRRVWELLRCINQQYDAILT